MRRTRRGPHVRSPPAKACEEPLAHHHGEATAAPTQHRMGSPKVHPLRREGEHRTGLMPSLLA
jgi:hypothetical protein